MAQTTNLKVTDEAPAAQQPKGFPGLICLLCGSENTVTVQLVDCSFCCTECGNELSTEEAHKTVEQWQRVLAWVASANQF